MPDITPREVERQLIQSWPAETWSDVPVMIAVSGGADSVALLRAITRIARNPQDRLMVAHFNHRWRGAGSTADEQFVMQLARQLGLPCVVGQASPRARSSEGVSRSEEAARRARYAFLQSAAERNGARYLVTAHTQDDQAETVLHRILRGTGISGLAGIRRWRPLSEAVCLVRPWLEVTRSEILEYLHGLGQAFRSDNSNQDSRFTRNRLRHELLPRLEQDYNPRVSEALVRLSRQALDLAQLVSALASDLQRACVVHHADGAVEIDCRSLVGRAAPIIRQLLVDVWRRRAWPEQAMTQDHWEQLILLCQRSSSATALTARTFPGCIQAEPREDLLVLRRLARTGREIESD